jgi:hypothetical protein
MSKMQTLAKTLKFSNLSFKEKFYLGFFLLMDLQPYSHNRFSKILRTFFESCSIPSMNAERKIAVRSHKQSLLHIPLLALTHGQNDGQRNKYTCCAWAGGTESQFVAERKLICELHNTSSKFDIRVKIL